MHVGSRTAMKGMIALGLSCGTAVAGMIDQADRERPAVNDVDPTGDLLRIAVSELEPTIRLRQPGPNAGPLMRGTPDLPFDLFTTGISIFPPVLAKSGLETAGRSFGEMQAAATVPDDPVAGDAGADGATTLAVAPEPGVLVFMLVGVLVLIARRRRRRPMIAARP